VLYPLVLLLRGKVTVSQSFSSLRTDIFTIYINVTIVLVIKIKYIPNYKNNELYFSSESSYPFHKARVNITSLKLE